MQFSYTEEQAMIADTAQSFFRSNATSERTRAAMVGEGVDRKLWSDFCQQLGFGGLLVAEDYGGIGLGMVEFASVAEAAGAQVAALPMLGQAVAATILAKAGSREQCKRWLQPIASGETIVAVAETNHLDGQGGRISGVFDYVPHAGVADIFILTCSKSAGGSDGAGKGSSDGASGVGGAWIVESETSGLEVETFTTMDQTRPLSKVTAHNATGEALADWSSAAGAARETAWLYLAAESLGGAQACLERTVDYVKERVQFGRPIGSFQSVKHRLADRMVDIEQARSAVYWAACAVDEQSADSALALHAAKSFCADVYFRTAADMIQLHGGMGFTWEHDSHLYFKRARANQTLLQDSAWHREQIATMLLGEVACG